MLSTNALALLPPPSTDPAPLPDIADGEEINLLARAAWSDPFNPLKVKFELWENSQPSEQDPEQIQIFLGTVEVGKKVWTAPINANDLFVPIPADRLLEGEHELHYLVTIWSQTTQGSKVFTITIDKNSPLLATDSTLIFPPEVSPPNSITAAYLADPANNDQVLATLPDYSGKKVGDMITWYWGSSDTDIEVVDTLTLEIDDITGVLPPLTFTGDMIRTRGDGKRYAHYQVEDRAGNVSLASERIELQVQAAAAPRNLPRPKVMEASGAGSTVNLDPINARQGVTFEIPKTNDIYPGEKVRVFWGREGKPGYYVSDWSELPTDRLFPVSTAYMPQNMGHSFPVKYQVQLIGGGDEQGIDSETLTVQMNMVQSNGLPYASCASPSVSVSNFPPAGLDVTLELKWFWILPGQYVHIWAKGVSGIQLVAEFQIEPGLMVTEDNVGDTITWKITAEEIAPFKIPSELTLVTVFSFDDKETWMDEDEYRKYFLKLEK